MNSSQYQKNEFKFLCAIVGSHPTEMKYILENIDSYYREWFEPKIDKETGNFKKYSDGTVKKRAMRPSLGRLKKIQSAIKDKILTPLFLPKNVHGGVKAKSNITNAKVHQGNKYLFCTDLQEFYPNIKPKAVYNALKSCGISVHKASWITKLTTWKNELPQGAPTSTHLANIVFLETDRKLISFCGNGKLSYTRFIDDLTFSSQQDFQPILNEIIRIIKADNFKINYRKTSYKGNQIVTGIEIHNNFINAPKKIKEKALFEIGIENASKPYTVYRDRIRGTNVKKK